MLSRPWQTGAAPGRSTDVDIKMRTTVTRSTFPDEGAVAREVRDLSGDLSREIRQRTSSGRDVSGGVFEPKEDGSRSTLEESGDMIRSFRPAGVTEKGFTLQPSRKQSYKALIHQTGRGRFPRRLWIGMSPSQIARARDRVTRALRGRQQ